VVSGKNEIFEIVLFVPKSTDEYFSIRKRCESFAFQPQRNILVNIRNVLLNNVKSLAQFIIIFNFASMLITGFKHTIFWFPIVFFILSFSAFAQKEDLSQVWPAGWIQASEGSAKDFGVTYFRKAFILESMPKQLVIHTSGDMRYQLFVNGKQVSNGPQTGDLRHWYYETTDIEPYLKLGKNLISASVLNYGSHPPDARLSIQTGFLLAADDIKFRFLNTNETWKALQTKAYFENLVTKDQINGYYGGGSREKVDGRLLEWGWEKPEYNDTFWNYALKIENAYAKTCIWASRWKLTPRTLPLEELESFRFLSVRRAEGVQIPAGFPKQKVAVTIPRNTKAMLLLDFGKETTAFPILEISGGENAVLKMRYSEAGYINLKTKEKGNRNETEGKSFPGYFDQFTADGGKERTYRPFHWRAFRYLVLEIETQATDLIIQDIRAEFSGYPFRKKSGFSLSGGKEDTSLIRQMMDVSLYTTRLCAHDTYIDCPYYEESQFEGDTRIEALISYLNFGDARLGKNAIEQFAWSLNDEGFLSARYPTNSYYFIPNFSLYWIGMLHDYMMYVGDKEFIQSMLPVSRHILQYFYGLQRPDGLFRKGAYHNFTDWSFQNGEAPSDENGYSSVADLHILMALQWAKDLEKFAGSADYQSKYETTALQLSSNIRKQYWDADKGLIKNTPSGSTFSQHANSLAVLTGVVEGEHAKILMKTVLRSENMTKATLYWSFYVFEALQKSGLGQEYFQNLGVWKEALDAGVSTWPETGLKSRSECHGWGGSPAFHFPSLVAGIRPTAAGFKEIEIEPNLEGSTELKTSIPHPDGQISMALSGKGKLYQAEIEIPKNTSGHFVWKGKRTALKGGKNWISEL